jgi:hypothetical protein
VRDNIPWVNGNFTGSCGSSRSSETLEASPYERESADCNNSKNILATYDQRPTIEQGHLELKCFQGIEKLPSTKFTHVVFRIIMGVLGYNRALLLEIAE